MSRSKSFRYCMTEKNGYLILSISGDLNKGCWSSLDQLITELHEKHPKYIILTLDEVSRCTKSAVSGLIRLQVEARKETKYFKVCQLNAKILEYLRAQHAVEESELEDDLLNALENVSKSSRAQNDSPRL